MMRQWQRGIGATLLLLTCLAPARADVAVSATRIVYDEGTRDRSLTLANTGDSPLLVQAWIDCGEGDPDAPPAPFAALPGVFFLPAQGLRALRVLHTGERLRADRESVYWVNLYQIPSSEAATSTNTETARVDVALNLQLKIFFRPAGLRNSAWPAPSSNDLEFRVSGPARDRQLHVRNPTQYHASFSHLSLQVRGQAYPVTQEMDMMAAPFSERVYQLGATPDDLQGAILDFAVLDDAGHAQTHARALHAGT